MTGYSFKKAYNKETEKSYIYLMSDLHLDAIDCDRNLIKEELDYAQSFDADILIGGDVFDMIIAGDRKRYTPGSDRYHTDSNINKAVKDGYNFLKPYIRNIKAIGHGNHETSIMKYNSYDPIDALLYELNNAGAKIIPLHYSGILRYSYEHTGGGQRRRFDIYFNHGQGGGAEVSKGTIMIDRHRKKVIADIYWFGHSHTKVILPDENIVYMNEAGNLTVKKVQAMITGCYKKIFLDTTGKDCLVNYGEERMRVNQSQGGIMLEITNRRDGLRINTRA